MTARRKRTAILISSRGSNMAALIDAAAHRDYPAEIALVISNRPGAAGLAHAMSRGVEAMTIDHKAFGSRETFDAALDEQLKSARIEIVCLAGFMRVLTDRFVESWRGRIINIHPSLLPAFKGVDTHARALAAGAKMHGCTVHFVVPELDAGPIILQAEVPVKSGDDEASLAARVLKEEHRIYPLGLKLLAQGKVRLEGGRAVRLDH